MKRDEILATVLRISKDVISDLKDGDIDVNKPYRDLGINSLNLMEILVGAMKELKIKIPADQLASVGTISGLVDEFVKASA
ncbi:MAG: acyl carrier protein [Desulfobacteraceae bacterium]|nr:acyl carrier protein [Desulfobacteraceae bacterium]